MSVTRRFLERSGRGSFSVVCSRPDSRQSGEAESWLYVRRVSTASSLALRFSTTRSGAAGILIRLGTCYDLERVQGGKHNAFGRVRGDRVLNEIVSKCLWMCEAACDATAKLEWHQQATSSNRIFITQCSSHDNSLHASMPSMGQV